MFQGSLQLHASWEYILPILKTLRKNLCKPTIFGSVLELHVDAGCETTARRWRSKGAFFPIQSELPFRKAKPSGRVPVHTSHKERPTWRISHAETSAEKLSVVVQ